ncbi:MAG: glycoside hydrolase family 2 protein [Planctomycetota bacterium]
MKTSHSLSELEWKLAGFLPHMWRRARSIELGVETESEIPCVPATVPGSVQRALREADLLPDWYVGLDARACEWVEHRHWVFQARLPDAWLADAGGARCVLRCYGLDYEGVVRVNGGEAGAFCGTFTPHAFDLTPCLQKDGNLLEIVFFEPPRWLGQFGYTSRMTEWKARFNYTWDWTSRVVQIGIWDDLVLETTAGPAFERLEVRADADPAAGTGMLRLSGGASGGDRVTVTLADADGRVVREETEPLAAFVDGGISWSDLGVELWWPNGEGAQPLYTVTCRLLDADGSECDRAGRRVGFRRIEWRPCVDAPEGALPWICVVNGRPIFLQGVNWTPVRPTFADVPADETVRRVALYRDLGCNTLRVWGGAVLETEAFYDACDERGLLVWQEFPLSSSGLDNWPPEDPDAIAEMEEIVRSYIERRQHHASLFVWCGGNELQGALDGGKQGCGRPVDGTHPMIAAMERLVAALDPGRRFLPTSSSGPRFIADADDFGKGIHHDVHGPWKLPDETREGARAYWAGDDSLFRSETGAPGASPADIIREYAGDLPLLPGTRDNPLWRRTSWWIEWPTFVAQEGHEPESLEAYVAWSQARQADGLALAVQACKDRFPAMGGILLWMGHDSFPCTANTAIVDFHGRPKPAALALEPVFRSRPAAETDGRLDAFDA